MTSSGISVACPGDPLHCTPAAVCRYPEYVGNVLHLTTSNYAPAAELAANAGVIRIHPPIHSRQSEWALKRLMQAVRLHTGPPCVCVTALSVCQVPLPPTADTPALSASGAEASGHQAFGPTTTPSRAVLRKPFLLRTALKNSPQGQPTANRQPLPTAANRRQRPTTNRQPLK